MDRIRFNQKTFFVQSLVPRKKKPINLKKTKLKPRNQSLVLISTVNKYSAMTTEGLHNFSFPTQLGEP